MVVLRHAFGGSLLWSKGTLHLLGVRLRCCDHKTQTYSNVNRSLHVRPGLLHVFHIWVQAGSPSSYHHDYTPASRKGGNQCMFSCNPYRFRVTISPHFSLPKHNHVATSSHKRGEETLTSVQAKFFVPRSNSCWVEEKDSGKSLTAIVILNFEKIINSFICICQIK